MTKEILHPAASAICAVLVFCLPSACRADLIFALSNSLLNGAPNTTVEFSGTLTNDGSTPVYLNGDVSTLLYPNLILDDSPFFTNAPLSLAPAAYYSGPFFDVVIAPSVLSGLYSGTFTVQGGADPNTFDDLATQDFQVNVISTPEVTSLRLFCFGIIMLIGRGTLRRHFSKLPIL